MKKFLKESLMSYYYALRGIKIGLKERSMKVHFMGTIVVIAMSIFFKISSTEWMIIILVIIAVWSAELFNTAIESICNEERDDLGVSYNATAKARDVAAGAVLIIVIGAVIIGGIIFIPKILTLIG